ncbi:MAG: ABC transporter permease [bacterium]
MIPENFFYNLGRRIITFFREIGNLALLLLRILRSSKYIINDKNLLFKQMLKVGVNSLPLVFIVSVFTGAVSAWQAAYQFRSFGLISMDILGGATSAAIFIELSPVLTGIVIAGRVGASIAAELGSMKVTEQIDAMETLAIEPVRFLASPRFFAGLIMLPILVIFSNVIAHLGAFLVGCLMLDVSTFTFFNSVQKYFIVYNVISGLIKAIVFGGGTALIGCSIGFRTTGGAEGVGFSTIKAFVYSSAFILIGDYILAVILF